MFECDVRQTPVASLEERTIKTPTTLPLDVRRPHKNQWLLAIDLCKIRRALGSEIQWLHVLDIPVDTQLRLDRFRGGPEVVMCVHGCIMIDWADIGNKGSDYILVDDDPESPNFHAYVLEASQHYLLGNINEDTSHVLIFSGEEAPLCHAEATSFCLENLGLELNDQVACIYLNKLDAGAIMGNHAHRHKHEKFFAMCGLFELQIVEVAIDEGNVIRIGEPEAAILSSSKRSPYDRDVEIPPCFAHAMRAMGDGVNTLLVFDTGEPYDNSDDYPCVVIPE